ncbi:MAG: nitrate ABC transporter substrate-binding protein, partial [Eubacterium sp.]|nr:nitrate ABC transporter substrate-binding protein [Eubacterium sp.]
AAPELDENLVKRSQAYLSKEYVSDAASWGVIDDDRWNAFYSWLNENKLVETELPAGAGLWSQHM